MRFDASRMSHTAKVTHCEYILTRERGNILLSATFLPDGFTLMCTAGRRRGHLHEACRHWYIVLKIIPTNADLSSITSILE
jgi:hypothetical protein